MIFHSTSVMHIQTFFQSAKNSKLKTNLNSKKKVLNQIPYIIIRIVISYCNITLNVKWEYDEDHNWQ